MNPIQPKTKRCISCQGLLPVEAFGLYKYATDGYAVICKECRSQFQRRRRKIRFNAKGIIDDHVIREVKGHNISILDQIIHMDKTEIRGFDCHTKMEYKVFYGISDRLGLKAMTLVTRSGEVFIEWALSGVKDPKMAIVAYLKAHNIRLEMSDADVISSKTTIYYFG